MSNLPEWHKHTSGEWHRAGRTMNSPEGIRCQWDTFYRGLGKPFVENGGLIYYKKGKKMKKMEKIYWDESQQQIRTKGGECLLDKAVLLARLNSLEERIKGHQVTRNILSIRLAKLENAQYTKTLYDKNLGKIKTLTDSINSYAKAEFEIKKQLQCSAKTQGKHKMVFVKKNGEEKSSISDSSGWTCINVYSICTPNRDFVFKCSVCDLAITKTEKELSAVEKEGLKKLKLL